VPSFESERARGEAYGPHGREAAEAVRKRPWNHPSGEVCHADPTTQQISQSSPVDAPRAAGNDIDEGLGDEGRKAGHGGRSDISDKLRLSDIIALKYGTILIAYETFDTMSVEAAPSATTTFGSISAAPDLCSPPQSRLSDSWVDYR